MSYIIYFVILYLNAMFSFFKKHSKIVALFSFIFVWILFWGNTDNPDLRNYITSYDQVINNTITFNLSLREPGYFIIMKIFANLGISYHGFIACIGLICYLLIFSTVKKYTNNYNYICFLYMIHLFVFDIIQMRNFISVSIIVYAIRYLVEYTNKGKIKYIICILIASTIHNTALFFLILIIIKRNNTNSFVKFIAIFSIVGCIIVFFNGGKIPFISEIMNNLLEGTVRGTYLNVVVPLRYIISLFLLQIVNFTMILICRNQSNKIYNKEKISNEQREFINLIFWANTIAFMFLPLYMQSINFYRLMRNLNILNFICVSIASNGFKYRSNNKIIFNLFNVGGVIAWFIYDLSISFSHFQSILENNLIFK